jgi:integrase
VEDGRIQRNPCSRVRLPKAESTKVVPWETATAEAVRAAMPARYAAMVDAGAGLGMRQGEVFGLAAEDIDWLRQVVHVRRQVRIVGAKLVYSLPKGDKERDVPLPSSIALRLSAHIAAFPPVPVTLPWKAPDGKPVTARLLFTTTAGGALRRSTWNVVAWKAALKAAGAPDTRHDGFHVLRHTFASMLLSRGVDVRTLAEYLGHTDPGFTLRVYSHLMPDSADRMRQAIDAAFAAPDGPATAQAGAR